MDADEIRTLLGDNIFERAKKYRKRIQQSTCTVNEDGVRHISAMVQGSGGSYYYTQAWLRENGSFVSASCSCPYNQNGRCIGASGWPLPVRCWLASRWRLRRTPHMRGSATRHRVRCNRLRYSLLGMVWR